MTNYVGSIQQRLTTIQQNDASSQGQVGTAPQQSGNLGQPDAAAVELALKNLKSANRVSGENGLGAPMALGKTLVNNMELLDRIGALAEKDRTKEMKEFLKVMSTAAELGALMMKSADELQAFSPLYDVANLTPDDSNYEVVAEITRLIQQMLISVNRTVSSMSADAMNHQFDSMMSAADKMDAAAKDRFNKEVTEAFTAIGTGAAAIGMGAMAAKKGYESSRAEQAGKAPGIQGALDPLVVDDHVTLKRSADNYSSISRGVGEGGGGIGKAASATDALSAARNDADKQRHEAVAGVDGQMMHSAQNLMQALKDAMNKMVEFNAQIGKLDADLNKKIMS